MLCCWQTAGGEGTACSWLARPGLSKDNLNACALSICLVNVQVCSFRTSAIPYTSQLGPATTLSYWEWLGKALQNYNPYDTTSPHHDPLSPAFALKRPLEIIWPPFSIIVFVKCLYPVMKDLEMDHGKSKICRNMTCKGKPVWELMLGV